MRALVLAALATLALIAPAHADAFVVVVNAKNPVAAIDRATVAEAFLKKRTRWRDDSAILPVDQLRSSATRRRFSSDVLERSVEAVRTYWNQLVFSGRGVPPPELDGDDAVVHYVAAHAGAIGYVAAGTTLAGVKVVKVD